VSFRGAERFRRFEEQSDFVISRSVATRNPCPEHSEGSFRLLTCVRSDRGEVEMTQETALKELKGNNLDGFRKSPDV
jgi:hypothetical protein